MFTHASVMRRFSSRNFLHWPVKISGETYDPEEVLSERKIIQGRTVSFFTVILK